MTKCPKYVLALTLACEPGNHATSEQTHSGSVSTSADTSPATTGTSATPTTGGSTASTGVEDPSTSGSGGPGPGDTTIGTTGTIESSGTTDVAGMTLTGSDESSGTTSAPPECPPDTTLVQDWVLLSEPANLQELVSIECIEGNVSIAGSAGSLESLIALRRIGGSLFISEPGWANTGLAGLEGLEFVGGVVRIFDVDLESLNGLNNLAEVGSLEFHGVTPGDFDGLDSLTTIHGRMMLGEFLAGWTCPNLVSLSGLPSLVSIGHDMEIYGTALTELSGLADLQAIGGELRIHHNASLPNCEAFTFAESVNVGGDVEIVMNKQDACL
jgi:hypothetical protein